MQYSKNRLLSSRIPEIPAFPKKSAKEKEMAYSISFSVWHFTFLPEE
jgi:hypothetical protein